MSFVIPQNGYFIVIVLSFSSLLYSQEQCRKEELEGWRWGSSMTYSCPLVEDGSLDFEPIHQKMKQRMTNILRILQDKNANICIGQFNFILEPLNGSSNPVLPQWEEVSSVKIPLQDHVFVSGDAIPELKGCKAKYIRTDDISFQHFFQARYEIANSQSPEYDKNAESAAPFISKSVFIHPDDRDKKYFTDLPNVVDRLVSRYKNTKIQPLPTKASLAREWHQLLGKKEDTPEVHQAKAAWFNKANLPGPSHCNNKNIKKESRSVFFTNNEDSEQKILYYLNCITNSLEGFILLKQIMEKIKEYCQCLDWYRTSRIDHLMKASNSQDVALRNEIEELLLKIPNKEENEDGDNEEIQGAASIEKDFQELENYLDSQKQKMGSESYMLKELRKLTGLVKKTFADLPSLLLKNPSIDNLFKDIENKEIFKVDKTIKDFWEYAQTCLSIYPKYYISAVVLNLHSKNDCCYGCGPDLAEESIRNDGFASYFINEIRKLNPEQREPVFRMIFSCGNIREDIRCDTCKKRDEQEPIWSKPDKTVYYQHYLKPQSVDTVKSSLCGTLRCNDFPEWHEYDIAVTGRSGSSEFPNYYDYDEQQNVNAPNKDVPKNRKRKKDRKGRERPNEDEVDREN